MIAVTPIDDNKLILEWNDTSDLSFIMHLIGLAGDRNSLLKEIEFLMEEK